KDPKGASTSKEKGNASFKARDYTAAALDYLQHGYPSHLQHKLQDRHIQCLNHLSNHGEGLNTPKQGEGDHAEGVCSSTRGTKSPNSQQQQKGSAPVSSLPWSVCLSPGIEDEDSDCKPIREKIGLELAFLGLITEKISPKEKDYGSSNTTRALDNIVHPTACYHGDSYLSVYHLLRHLSGHAPSLCYLCSITIATLYLCLRQARPPPASWERGRACVSRKYNNQSQGQEEDEKEKWRLELSLLGSVVLRHMLKLQCDFPVVQSSQEACIATAIFPTLRVLNHSCSPKTSVTLRTAHLDSPQPDLY
ncbi:unnamed protein product, partial [Coregonus sp. 'balchen']